MKAATDSPRQLLRIIDQLAIFLENRPGALVAVCDALAEAAINIYGMTVSDTVDHAVVRLVVSDSRKAVSVLEAHGALVVEDEVLMLENDNRPGGLSSVARKLAEKKINIEYAYLASIPNARKGLLILRVNNPKKALKILSA